jgi:stage IV sporulation protein FA
MSYKDWWEIMRSRSDDIRKRIEKRKRDRERMSKHLEARLPWAEDEERYGFEKLPSYESDYGSKFDSNLNETSHPLFRKEIFIFKILASACLVLIIAIMFRNTNSTLDPAREVVTKAMSEDFQFAAVSEWYEETFGKQLALLPSSDKEVEEESENVSTEVQYALPASGKISEEFDDNGQRITIEVGQDAPVEAMNGGLVLFVGEKDGFGKTVVIQHSDKSETWYGNLNDVNVSLYEYIKKGTQIGKAIASEDGTKSSFYLAIKQGDDFIDPIQVMQVD